VRVWWHGGPTSLHKSSCVCLTCSEKAIECHKLKKEKETVNSKNKKNEYIFIYIMKQGTPSFVFKKWIKLLEGGLL
jgi:hypothetical protein